VKIDRAGIAGDHAANVDDVSVARDIDSRSAAT